MRAIPKHIETSVQVKEVYLGGFQYIAVIAIV